MLVKRIIACLDVKAGRVVKGKQFVELKDSGDALELAVRYVEQGIDELVFLDISATLEERKPLKSLVRQVASQINIPFVVGGGVSSLADAAELLESGADKISINSAALKNPALIGELAAHFGSQCVVVAIDSRRVAGQDIVFTRGGTSTAWCSTLRWAKEAAERGAGEILLTSIDHDGMQSGFACELTAEISSAVQLPVIASGGAGSMSHFLEIFSAGLADAALAAGILHRQEIEIPVLKAYLKANQVEVRI